mgnify:CR=1 FL=1
MINYYKSNPYKFINDYIGNLKWYQKLLLKFYCRRKDRQIIIVDECVDSVTEIKFNNNSSITTVDGQSTRGLRSKIKEIM